MYSTRAGGRGRGFFDHHLRREVRMKSKHQIGDPLRVRRGPEDFALVVLEWLYPVGDIAGVLRESVGIPSSDATKAEASSARNSSIA